MNFIRRPEVLSQRASKDGGPEIACLYRDGDVPLRRAIQRCGAIITTPILSGLHNRYVRI